MLKKIHELESRTVDYETRLYDVSCVPRKELCVITNAKIVNVMYWVRTDMGSYDLDYGLAVLSKIRYLAYMYGVETC